MITNLLHRLTGETAACGSNSASGEGGKSGLFAGGSFQNILNSLEHSLEKQKNSSNGKGFVSDPPLRTGLGGLVQEQVMLGEKEEGESKTAPRSAASGEEIKESSVNQEDGEREKKATRQAGSGSRKLPAGEALLEGTAEAVSDSEESSNQENIGRREETQTGSAGSESRQLSSGETLLNNTVSMPTEAAGNSEAVTLHGKREIDANQPSGEGDVAVGKMTLPKENESEKQPEATELQPSQPLVFEMKPEVVGSEKKNRAPELTGSRGETESGKPASETRQPLTGETLLNQGVSAPGETAVSGGASELQVKSTLAETAESQKSASVTAQNLKNRLETEPQAKGIEKYPVEGVRGKTIPEGQLANNLKDAVPSADTRSSSPVGIGSNEKQAQTPLHSATQTDGIHTTGEPSVKGTSVQAEVAQESTLFRTEPGRADQKADPVTGKEIVTDRQERERAPVLNQGRRPISFAALQSTRATTGSESARGEAPVPQSHHAGAVPAETIPGNTPETNPTVQAASSAFVPVEAPVKKERMDLSAFDRSGTRRDGFSTEYSGNATRGVNRVTGASGQFVQDLSSTSKPMNEPTADELLWTEHTTDEMESSESRSSDLQSIAFSRLTELHVTNLYVRRTVLPGLTQAVLGTTSEGKASENWQRHNFVLEDGSRIRLSARESEGVLHIKLAATLGELNKILQLHQDEIREHLEKECNLQVDLQFEGGDQEAEESNFFMNGRQGRPSAQELSEEERENTGRPGESTGYSERMRSFGYNQKEWTA